MTDEANPAGENSLDIFTCNLNCSALSFSGCLGGSTSHYERIFRNPPPKLEKGLAFWVAVRRTYVFTLQEVEKICRTLQSHLTLHRTISYWLSADEAELLPVSRNKLPFFQSKSWHKLHKILFAGAYVLLLHQSRPALLTSTLHD